MSGAATSSLTLSLQGGGLEEDLVTPFTLDAHDQAQAPALPERLTWSCNRSTGEFRGTQVIPGTLKAISFNGVFLQDRGVGAGCFRGAEQGGAVWLEQDNH